MKVKAIMLGVAAILLSASGLVIQKQHKEISQLYEQLSAATDAMKQQAESALYFEGGYQACLDRELSAH